MKKIILLTIVSISVLHSFAQTIVSGKISDNKGNGISAASIRIKENGEGINADSSGQFSLSLSGSGKRTLEVSSIGFRTSRQPVELNGETIQLKITLNPARGELAEVVINAGSFEASDKAKGASLTPIDAVTVAGNGNDLANSLRSLPGSQNVGEKEG
ncbi:MAG TPA: carboxypeptidase-like regulatory domain-containing protein, partial [Flavitalea sp.]|nr:carboxypeptidase-like regulatory domain-containing protein [Flavitalea sp.]